MLPVDKAAQAARADITANKNLDYDERYEFWQKEYGHQHFNDKIHCGDVIVEKNDVDHLFFIILRNFESKRFTFTFSFFFS
jgi:hypothetical protein